MDSKPALLGNCSITDSEGIAALPQGELTLLNLPM